MSTVFYELVKILSFKSNLSSAANIPQGVCPEHDTIRITVLLPIQHLRNSRHGCKYRILCWLPLRFCRTDIDNYMINLSVFRIEDQVSRCCFADRDFHSVLRLCSRCSRKTDPELCIYMLCKTGTVCSRTGSVPPPYIRVTDKLQCIIDQRLTVRILHRCFFHRFECIVAYFIIFRCNFLCRKSTYGFRILSCIGIVFAFSAASSPISRYSLLQIHARHRIPHIPILCSCLPVHNKPDSEITCR